MSIDNKKIHILGGGPAGIALAHYANKKNISFSLFESSDSVGGNAKTIRRGDFLFDTGAHRFHNKNEKVTLEIKEILKGDLHKVSSPSKIFWNNNLIDFPISISSIFKNINLKTNLRIIVENLLCLKRKNNNQNYIK